MPTAGLSMLIFPVQKTSIVHIPRTAGVALGVAAARLGAVWMNWVGGMHLPASVARSLFAGDISVLAVIRNPWSIYRSHYGWVQKWALCPDRLERGWFRDAVLYEASLSFSDLVRHCAQHNVLENGDGFLATYCDGFTDVYKYEDSPWGAIAERLSITLDMAVENASDVFPEWDQQSIDIVGNRCVLDIERFGYTAPPCGADC